MNASVRRIRLVRGEKDACPKCSGSDIASRSYSDTVDFRNLEFDVEGLLDSKCQNCGHVWTTHEQNLKNQTLIREIYAGERDRLRAKQGLLSGQEIAQLREQLGLNQREAAALFGGGYNAFNKYESGEVLQSFAMDRLLRLTKVVGKPAISFLKDVTSKPSFVVVSTTSAAPTASQAAFLVTYASKHAAETLVRTVETVTDSIIGSFAFQELKPAPRISQKHENHVFGR